MALAVAADLVVELAANQISGTRSNESSVGFIKIDLKTDPDFSCEWDP